MESRALPVREADGGERPGPGGRPRCPPVEVERLTERQTLSGVRKPSSGSKTGAREDAVTELPAICPASLNATGVIGDAGPLTFSA